jgi:hypothetical protein
LSTCTTFNILPEVLAETKDEHVEFGCMPSFNVYNMVGEPLNGREVPFRSAGGHIHLGYNYKNNKDFKMDGAKVVRTVKALDAILGVACVSLFASLDDPRRRRMYGLAGEYRLPMHGLEYRTLSNAWLCHPLITNIVFDLARKAAEFGVKGLLRYWNCSQEETIRIIQECDVASSRKVLDENKKLLIKILSSAYGDAPNSGTSIVYDIFRNGVENFIADPTDLTNNWCLTGSNKLWLTHCNGKGKQVHTAKAIISIKKQKVS